MTLRLPLLLALFISVLASPLAAQTLIHYWNFNNSASEAEQLTPSQSLTTGSGIEHIQGGISLIQITSNTAQGFDVANPNARNGDPAGTHLRFNDPIGGALRFNLPTTGFQQVVVKYATRRSGSGAGLQIIDFSTDGVSFDSLTSIEPANGDPTLQTIDFSGVPGVNDNANFALRIRFAQGPGGAVGNNRFDNFTLEGIGAGTDLVPPTVVFQPVNAAIDQPINLQPTLTFNEDVRLVSNTAITPADILNIIEWRLGSDSGIPIAFSGSINGRIITLAAGNTLQNNQTYYLALKAGSVEDTSNNVLSDLQSITFSTIPPQTVFQSGDMVPVAYRMNATGGEDEVALLTFVDILPGTKINLTDAKYTDNAQPQCAGGIQWTSPLNTILPSGSIIVIQNSAGTASVGTVAGSTFGLSSNGDQVIVYTGTADNPNYITALSSNAWLVANTACSGSNSKRPDALEDGVSSISLSTAPGNIAGNTVNGFYNGIQTGTIAELQAAILDPANWNGIGGGTPPQVWPAWNFPGPPAVVSSSVVNQNTLQVVYNRDMDVAATTNPANYTGIANLTNVSLSSNGALNDTATLSYSTPFTNGTSYLLEVSGVKDTEDRSLLGVYSYAFTYNTTVRFANRYTTATEDAGTVKVQMIVENPSQASFTVSYKGGVFSTANTADFDFSTEVVNIDGSSSSLIEIEVAISDDNVEEQDEYMVLSINNPTGITVDGADFYTIYIQDNDRLAPVADENITLNFVSRYTVDNPNGADGIAEITAYDPDSKRLFSISTALQQVDIIDFSNPANPTQVQTIGTAAYGPGLTSIAVRNGIVAISVTGPNNEQENGSVIFLNTDGVFQKQVTVGALPDMIAFTPDGNYVLTANEGQPNNAYNNDPEGTVSLIDISGGINNLTQANVQLIDFTAFNAQEAALIASGVRKLKASSTLAQDFEPEYITIAPDGKTAWVTLQENNAVAVLDLENKIFTSIVPLGTKDYNAFGNGLDLSDQNPSILIANWPLKGFFIPDAIANYEVNGMTYLVTANEGDEKEYAGLNERTTVGAVTLDPTAFPNGAMLKENHAMGRMRITNFSGDTDGDGDFDELYCVGARSFTIWNATTGALVFDSGDDFEKITAANPLTAPIFNADNGGNGFKGRSRAKGPEPEGVVIGRLNNRTFAFIVLERIGGVMVYDVTDPNNAIFTDYVNTRDNMTFAGDNGVEGILFIPAYNSPDGKNYIVTSNEVSGTVAVFEVGNVTVSNNEVAPKANVVVFPNPVSANGTVQFNGTYNADVFTLEGRLKTRVENAQNFQLNGWTPGTYVLVFDNGVVKKISVQ